MDKSRNEINIYNLPIDPKKINPLSRVDLVIDHSVIVDKFGSENSYEENVQKEFLRNKERYEFLKWGQNSFNNLHSSIKVLPVDLNFMNWDQYDFLVSDHRPVLLKLAY